MSEKIYPSIPTPSNDVESLHSSVKSLKMGYEILAGMFDDPTHAAITRNDLEGLGLTNNGSVSFAANKADPPLPAADASGLLTASINFQGGIAFNTLTKVTFPNPLYNNGNGYDATTSSFRPGRSGLVDFCCAVYYDGTVTQVGRVYGLLLFKNGGPNVAASLDLTNVVSSNSVYCSTATQFISVPLVTQDLAAVDDTYELYAYHQAAANQTILGFPNATFFRAATR